VEDLLHTPATFPPEEIIPIGSEEEDGWSVRSLIFGGTFNSVNGSIKLLGNYSNLIQCCENPKSQSTSFS
jgi:hypothetical protein